MFDRVYGNWEIKIKKLEIKNADMDQDSRHITQICDVIEGFGVYILNHNSVSKLP